MSIEDQFKVLALQRSAMCENLTYRSAGAEVSVRMDSYKHIAPLEQRWRLGSVGTVFCQLNPRNEPFSYIELTFV